MAPSCDKHRLSVWLGPREATKCDSAAHAEAPRERPVSSEVRSAVQRRRNGLFCFLNSVRPLFRFEISDTERAQGDGGVPPPGVSLHRLRARVRRALGRLCHSERVTEWSLLFQDTRPLNSIFVQPFFRL